MQWRERMEGRSLWGGTCSEKVVRRALCEEVIFQRGPEGGERSGANPSSTEQGRRGTERSRRDATQNTELLAEEITSNHSAGTVSLMVRCWFYVSVYLDDNKNIELLTSSVDNQRSQCWNNVFVVSVASLTIMITVPSYANTNLSVAVKVFCRGN